MKITFSFSDTNSIEKGQVQVSEAMIAHLKSKKDFYVQFGNDKIKKSSDQLRAIYKLFQLCMPHFERWKPQVTWSLETIKEFTKAELGYVRNPNSFEIAMMIKQSGFSPKDDEEKKKMIRFCKRIKQNISFAEFTKEQAYNFVNELEVWAQTPNQKMKKTAWSDVYLTNEEKESFWTSLERIYAKK